MKRRCFNPTVKHHINYGGRGIGVCSRWLKFENFFADMGRCPAGMSLDRKDNDLGYNPTNCRWATPKEQARNRRSNRLVSVDGRQITISEAAELAGKSKATIRGRLNRGWSIERAMSC
jgi:hypothetical protein